MFEVFNVQGFRFGVSRFGVSGSWFRDLGYLQVRGFGLGCLEVLGLGVRGFERFVVLEVQIFEVRCAAVLGF